MALSCLAIASRPSIQPASQSASSIAHSLSVYMSGRIRQEVELLRRGTLFTRCPIEYLYESRSWLKIAAKQLMEEFKIGKCD